MGTIDLEYSDRAPGELLGQLERGKGNQHTAASNAGHSSEYAQALSATLGAKTHRQQSPPTRNSG